MQHEVFRNPIARSRAAFPLLVVLQADVVGGDSRLVVPLARQDMPPHAKPNKAVPSVLLESHSYTVALPLIGSIHVLRLGEPVGSLRAYRDDITRALDWLLFGI